MIYAEYSNQTELKVKNNQLGVTLITIDSSRKPAKILNLLLDTGAFITMVSKEEADKRHFPVLRARGCMITGFSEKGLLCDLRKISTAIFCGHIINDVIIATPHHDNIPVSEVIGMNILENFHFGIDLTEKKIFTRVRDNFISQKPKYQSGKVRLMREYDVTTQNYKGVCIP